MSRPAIGSHLKTSKTGYTHHGIYIGHDSVIHYAGLSNGLEAGPIEQVLLTTFHCGNGYSVVQHPNAKHSPSAVIDRARSRLGENGYNVFNNNCEHFCNWCIEGDHQSDQVDIGTTVGTGGLSGAAAVAARTVVASSGSVAGLSGSGVMSGLSSLGGVVGGGAAAGLGIGGLASGLASATLINKTVLADNPHLPSEERDARSTGRVASYAGAAAGTAGSIAAVSAMGTTAGLSAAGISSGLAAIGGTVGGGMAAGVAVTAAAPAAAAAAVGYGIYRLAKWLRG